MVREHSIFGTVATCVVKVSLFKGFVDQLLVQLLITAYIFVGTLVFSTVSCSK